MASPKPVRRELPGPTGCVSRMKSSHSLNSPVAQGEGRLLLLVVHQPPAVQMPDGGVGNPPLAGGHPGAC